MTHRALGATSRASDDYLRQRSIPDRFARLGLPVLLISGTADQRWHSSALYGQYPRRFMACMLDLTAAPWSSVPGGRDVP